MIRRTRRAYTLFQLLILLALLLLLLGMLLPAVQKVREAATRTQSMNNMKQLGLAMHNYNDSLGKLPPGVDDNHFSASTYLLPYIEAGNLFKSIDMKKTIDDDDNSTPRSTRIAVFNSPRDPIEKVHDKWMPTSYLYNDKVFFLNSKAVIPGSFPDGTSNTIVTGETLRGDGGKKAVDVQRQHVLLAKDKDITADSGTPYWKMNKNIAGDRCASWMDGRFLQGIFNGALKLNDPRPDVSAAGAGGVSTLRCLTDDVLVGLGDGSVRTVNAKRLSFTTWSNALDPADGNTLGADW